jgi:lysophospholipase L1-like esterase
VLLLGDSIRMSYQVPVRRGLAEEAEVVGPAENCQYSLYTLSSLERWLAELGTPDVVHWNNGIHDSGYNPNRAPVQIPLDVYRANLALILRRLQATGARIIWASSTPVHPDRPFREDQWSWYPEDIDRYNDAALSLMQENGITVNDLNAVVSADLDRFLSEDQLHLSREGIERCAQAAIEAIRACLPGAV